MDLIKYEQNCRVCLKSNNAYKNIFSHIVEGCQEPVVQILLSLFKVELSPHKAYPQFICRKCLTELENILLFKEDLVRNQDFLFGLFKAAYPNCVEKRDPDFFMLTENFNKQYAQNASLECCDFDKSVVIKSESISQADNEAEQNVKIACNTYRIEQTKEDNVNVETTKENLKKHFNTEHIETDENRNFSFRNVQDQEEQTHSIEQDIQDANQVEIPVTSTQDSHSETVIPQVSFLQKLDLITLEDAKNLKTQPKQLLRTRRRFVSKKSKLPKVASTSVGSLQTPVVRSSSTSRKNQLGDKDSPDRIINRSVNFLSRYGCRKLNKTYLKQFKSLLQGDAILTVHQRDKNPNKQNKKVSKKKELSLGSNFLFNKSDESKAVSKQKGCEHVNSLQNNNSSQRQGTSSSKLNLDVNNIRDFKRVESLKDINCDICPTEQSDIDKQNKINQNMKHLGPSPNKEETVSYKHTGNVNLLVKSKSRDDIPATLIESPGEYRPIPSKNFYDSDNSHNIAKPSYWNAAVTQSISSKTLKKIGSTASIKTDNSSVKTEQPIISDFNTTLYRSASLDDLSDFKKEIKEDILSIDDSRALVSNNVPGKLTKTIKSEPLTYLPFVDLRQIQSYKTGRPKSFREIHSTGTEATGEHPISLINSVNNLGSKTNKYWIDIKTSPRAAKPAPAIRKKRGLPKILEASGNRTNVLDITTQNVATNGVVSDIFNSKSQEFVTREVHDYCLRSKMPSTNIDSSHLNLDTVRRKNVSVESKKSITCANVLNEQILERTICQRASTQFIRQKSGLSEIKTESPYNADKMSKLSRSRLLNKQSCASTASCQPASRRLISQKSELSQIKTEASSNADEISELGLPHGENRTEPLGIKSKVVPVLQSSSVRHESGNSTLLRMKLKKAVCSENLSVLTYDTQGAQDCQESRKTYIPLANSSRGTSERNVLMGKVQKINMSEDDELHLTIIRTNPKQGEISENINNSQLDTYPGNRLKVDVEAKANEKSSSCICEPPNNHGLIRNRNYFHKRSRSCTDLPDQSTSGECKRKSSLENAHCSKRKRRPPVKYSPVLYQKPRVYYCYEGHIKKRYRFESKKL